MNLNRYSIYKGLYSKGAGAAAPLQLKIWSGSAAPILSMGREQESRCTGHSATVHKVQCIARPHSATVYKVLHRAQPQSTKVHKVLLQHLMYGSTVRLCPRHPIFTIGKVRMCNNRQFFAALFILFSNIIFIILIDISRITMLIRLYFSISYSFILFIDVTTLIRLYYLPSRYMRA